MTILFALLLSSLNASAVQINLVDFGGSGTYMVPVEDSALLPFSLFEVPKVEFKQNGDVATLEYTIPLALTGTENKISLTGKLQEDGSWKMDGGGAKMNCHAVQGFFNCPVSYYDIQVDQGARLEFLKSVTSSPAELNGMLTTARFFDGERIGVLRFKIQ